MLMNLVSCIISLSLRTMLIEHFRVTNAVSMLEDHWLIDDVGSRELSSQPNGRCGPDTSTQPSGLVCLNKQHKHSETRNEYAEMTHLKQFQKNCDQFSRPSIIMWAWIKSYSLKGQGISMLFTTKRTLRGTLQCDYWVCKTSWWFWSSSVWLNWAQVNAFDYGCFVFVT